MAAPPAKSEISGTPSRATANAGFGKLWDYFTGLLGTSGDAADARTALDVPSRSGAGASGTWGISVSGGAATAGTATNCSRSVLVAGLATGGGALTADRTITVPKASQAQAEAGADDATAMTPLRTKQAIAAQAPAVGVGQTWQNVLTTPGRTHSTSYQNATGKPIMVSVSADATDTSRPFQVSTNNADWVSVGRFAENTGLRENNVTVVVPDGHYYRINGAASITHWAELF